MMTRDMRPKPDIQSMRAARRGTVPALSDYRLLRVYVDGSLVGEPTAKTSTLQDEIDTLFAAAISDPDLHGKTIEIRVYDQHAEDCLDVQTAAAHDWTPLDFASGNRQTCRTCGAERK